MQLALQLITPHDSIQGRGVLIDVWGYFKQKNGGRDPWGEWHSVAVFGRAADDLCQILAPRSRSRWPC